MQSLDYYPSTSYYSSGFELADSDAQAQYYSDAYYGQHIAVSRKRQVDRACDHCRKRKTKCDGPSTKDHICTNCKQGGQKCSYVEISKPRGPPKAYVSALEDRMEKMESLLMRLRPDADLNTELGPPVIRDSWKDKDSTKEESSNQPQTTHRKSSLSAKAMIALSSSPLARRPVVKKEDTADGNSASDSDTDSQGSALVSSEDDIGELSLVSGIKRLTMHGLQPTDDDNGAVVDHQLRFHGKSSQYKLIGATRRLKEAYAEEARQSLPNADAASEAASIASTSASSQYAYAREVYWQTPQWELDWEGAHISTPAALPVIENPPEDLAASLIDLFFEHVNVQWPLLHRPTFERQRKQELHNRDVWFACLCQCVFAMASRWSDDPRVLPEDEGASGTGEQGTSDDKRWHKAGWKFFETGVEIHQARRSIVIPPCLFEIQTLVLLSMYLHGSEYEAASWLYVSVGLRKAQDVGAHRRQVYNTTPDVEGELWKRAFWILVVQDRQISASLGRDCCSREEEFDIELPEEVDDEYWENELRPELAFKQPEGKPSIVSAFTARIKLSQILAFALRTVGASDKSKTLLGLTGPGWKEKVVTELNSALTDWVKKVPEHLRWGLKMDNKIFAKQSATLFTSYYLLQIHIYRPFMPPSCSWAPAPCLRDHWHPHVDFPFPASALCTNAAHSFARIADQLLAGPVLSDVPVLVAGAHAIGAVALMCVWELKGREQYAALADIKPPSPSTKATVDGLLADVQTMLAVLDRARKHWSHADKMMASLKESLPGSDADAHLRLISMSDSEMNSPMPPMLQLLQPTMPQANPTSSSVSPFSGSGDWPTWPTGVAYESMTSFDWASLSLGTNSGYSPPDAISYTLYDNSSLSGQPYSSRNARSTSRQMTSTPLRHSWKVVDTSTLSKAQFGFSDSNLDDFYHPQAYGLVPEVPGGALTRQPYRAATSIRAREELEEPPTKRARKSRIPDDARSFYGSSNISLHTRGHLKSQHTLSQAVKPIPSFGLSRLVDGTQSTQGRRYPASFTCPPASMVAPVFDPYTAGAESSPICSPPIPIRDYQNQYLNWDLTRSQGQSSDPLAQDNSFEFNF